MNTFSIITPIHAFNDQKAEELLRCIASIHNQSYPVADYVEHIIVNDGSPVALRIPERPWIKVIDLPQNMQRITAYNEGFKAAKNDWIWPLDADDMLEMDALSYINAVANLNPDYQMFNFGNSYVHKDGKVTYRDAFKPMIDDVNGATGHEMFNGGNIVNGTYVFSRKIYEELGAFPEPLIKDVDCTEINYPAGGDQWVRELTMASPYDFSAWFQLEFPETRSYFMVHVDDEPGKIIKEIGNPFGQDYALFYKYTRKFRSKPLPEYLEAVYIR